MLLVELDDPADHLRINMPTIWNHLHRDLGASQSGSQESRFSVMEGHRVPGVCDTAEPTQGKGLPCLGARGPRMAHRELNPMLAGPMTQLLALGGGDALGCECEDADLI